MKWIYILQHLIKEISLMKFQFSQVVTCTLIWHWLTYFSRHPFHTFEEVVVPLIQFILNSFFACEFSLSDWLTVLCIRSKQHLCYQISNPILKQKIVMKNFSQKVSYSLKCKTIWHHYTKRVTIITSYHLLNLQCKSVPQLFSWKVFISIIYVIKTKFKLYFSLTFLFYRALTLCPEWWFENGWKSWRRQASNCQQWWNTVFLYQHEHQ